MGPIRLQGGHQVAVKSITRGLPPLAVAAIAASNSALVPRYIDIVIVWLIEGAAAN